MRAWQIYPHYNGNFTDSCSDCSYFFPTVRAQHLAGQVLAHLPLFQMAISQILALIWKLVFGRPGLGRTTPISKGNFTDSCSTLRVHIWQTRFWQIYPLSNGNFTGSCFDCLYLLPNLRTHIWQTRSWQIYPPSNGNFTDSWSILRSHIWQTNCWQI